MAADIKRALELIAQKQITPQDIQRITAIAHALDIPQNDAMMPILIALDTYYSAFNEAPNRIRHATKQAETGAVESAKHVLERYTEQLKQEAVAAIGPAAVEAMRTVAADVVRGTTTKSMAQWAIACIGVTVLGFGLFGWYMHSSGANSGYRTGYGAGYSKAMDEKAAAAWANTPEGRLAYRLAQVGSIHQLIRCDRPGWYVKDGVCFGGPALDGNTYGWRLP